MLRSRLGVTEVFDEKNAAKGLRALLHGLTGRTPKIKPARTFPAAMPWLRLDRIYLRGFTVLDAQVLQGAAWAKLSDHAPIVATLRLK